MLAHKKKKKTKNPHCRKYRRNRRNRYPNTRMYITAYFPGLIQALQSKVGGLN